MIIHGDCIEELKKLPENSVDAIITDPPYGLEFMGKNWDRGVPGVNFWIEMIRVLKPGGFLLSFGGTRTYHRMTCGIEDAGFEIRDTIMWLYGSGFPKSLNIGKQIDKIQGNEREVYSNPKEKQQTESKEGIYGDYEATKTITKGNTEWEGWGTALKPACEPIVVARKPLSEKNVALNVLKWGTGGINIDESRIGNEDTRTHHNTKGIWSSDKADVVYGSNQGRFPSNVILNEEAGRMLDEQSGESISRKGNPRGTFKKGMFANSEFNKVGTEHNDKGGASRFFYCAKASKSERNLGCDDFEGKAMNDLNKMGGSENTMLTGSGNPRTKEYKNNHPTVKPLKLMEYLVKLVTREGAIVLDPFIGSGTTAIACIKTNRQFIGIEKEEEYVKIANARIKPFIEQEKLI